MPTVRLTDRAVSAATAAPGQRLELWDASTPGLCLRVTDKGQKTFVFRYRTLDGRQPRLTLGTFSPAYGLAEARRAAEKLKVAVHDGADPAGERKKRKLTVQAEPLRTFNDLADAFLEASARGTWKPRNKQKRARTIDDERGILRRHIRPALGHLRLEEIDRRTVRDFLRGMASKGIGAQVNRAHAVIRQTFAYGIGEERVTVNPAAGLAPVAEEAPRDRVLTDAELRSFWRALDAPSGLTKPAHSGSTERAKVYVGRPAAIAVQLCALLLQRRQEIAGMRLDELDLSNATWTVPAHRMKGGKPHMVPLPPLALQLIHEAIALANAEGRQATPFVFPGARKRDAPLRPDTITHVTRDVVAALGLPNASPHDLRRTGATNLVSERIGVAPFVVSRVLSHRSDLGGAAAVTLAHYAIHDFAPEKRRALEAWEALLMEIVEDRPRAKNVLRLDRG